jgi:hypothetical protein
MTLLARLTAFGRRFVAKDRHDTSADARALEALLAKSEDALFLAAAEHDDIERDPAILAAAERYARQVAADDVERDPAILAAAEHYSKLVNDAEGIDADIDPRNASAAALETHNAVLAEIRAENDRKQVHMTDSQVHALAAEDPRVVRALQRERDVNARLHREALAARGATKKEDTHMDDNTVLNDLIYPSVKQMQRPGEDILAAFKRWQESGQDARLMMKAAGIALPIAKARPVNALEINQRPRQTDDYDDAVDVNDPAAAVADTKALIEQAMTIRPWMSVEQATKYVEDLRLEVQGRRSNGRSARGSSPGRLNRSPGPSSPGRPRP